jgi:hypothetical protein
MEHTTQPGMFAVVQFRVNKVITEPSAVAPDAKINLCPKQVGAHGFSVNFIFTDRYQRS